MPVPEFNAVPDIEITGRTPMLELPLSLDKLPDVYADVYTENSYELLS